MQGTALTPPFGARSPSGGATNTARHTITHKTYLPPLPAPELVRSMVWVKNPPPRGAAGGDPLHSSDPWLSEVAA